MDRPSEKTVMMCAAASAFGWVAMFVAKGSGHEYIGACFGLIYHLALAPVVLALPSVGWAKAAGYIWIFRDAGLDVAGINGLVADNVWALRLGAHISASAWIIGTSVNMRPVARVTGVLLGGSLALHAVTAPLISAHFSPFASQAALSLSAFPLMLVWLGLIAFGVAKTKPRPLPLGDEWGPAG